MDNTPIYDLDPTVTPEMREQLLEKLKNLPAAPGVYFHKNAEGRHFRQDTRAVPDITPSSGIRQYSVALCGIKSACNQRPDSQARSGASQCLRRTDSHAPAGGTQGACSG